MEEIVVSVLPVIAVLLPLLSTGPMFFVRGAISEDFRDYLAIGVSVITFLAVMAMIPPLLGGKIIEYVLISKEVTPVEIAFRVDHLGLIVAIASSFVWMLATIYSRRYMAHEHAKDRYYAFMVLTLGAMMGIVLTKNLFALYIFFEMMALSSYVLVIHRETEEALSAGKKYLFISIGFGLFLLLSILMTYMIAGTLNLDRIGILPHDAVSKLAYGALFFAFIAGFGAKAGMFPVHIWLPDAHPVAPSPASALLSGVMIKAGAYGIIRVIYNVFGPELVSEIGVNTILAILAGITIFLGSAVAISQKEIKRMLAYSSISQIGYVILGATLLTHEGLKGGIFHIFNHAFMKGCLFLCAGAIIHQTGLRNIDDFGELGQKMPVTMLCFTIAALSMIGVPPLNGFVSKWILCLGALEAGNVVLVLFVAVLLLSSLMNAIYYMPIIIKTFFGPKSKKSVKKVEPELSMLIPIVALALGCLIFGIFANLPLSIIELAVHTLLG